MGWDSARPAHRAVGAACQPFHFIGCAAMTLEFDKAPADGLRLAEAAEQWCDPELVEHAKEALRQWVDAGGLYLGS
jgi:hypothetical protein